MWIAANTNVKLLSGVPLDPTNDHTIYFSSKENQTNYFLSKTKWNLSNYVFQRYTKGSIRVEKNADSLYDCNYIMFQNTSFGNRWFYAFITNITYINNSVSEIEYEMDDLQTWWFDFLVDECWIDREHSATDNIGDNTIPENIETGEFIRTGGGDFFEDSNTVIVVVTSKEDDGTVSDGEFINGIYSALEFKIFSTAQGANDYISVLTNQAQNDAIVAIFQVPEWMKDAGENPNISQAISTYCSKKYDNLDGYVPKNNKLFTAQFNSLVVTDNNGNFNQYSYEMFSGENCTFEYRGTMATGAPSAIIYPVNYNRSSVCINERVVMDTFPICPYVIDSYRAWLAQNKGTLITGIGTSIIGDIIKTVANPAAGIGGLLTDVASTVGSLYDHSRTPPIAAQTKTPSSMRPYRKMCFSFSRVYVKAEYARIIDNFFTRFGYKTNRLKRPNMNVRENFCYTRTIGCTITGDIPGDAARNICNIYNTGITFWKNPSVIGDYTVSNNPV